MKKKWMKKLVCLAAAVMMIGTSASAAVTTVDFQASFAAGRTPSIIASATLPRESKNGR